MVAVVILTAFTTPSFAALSVLSRKIDACSKNVRCYSVSKELCTYQTSDGPLVEWCIDCAGAGTTKCPNSIVYNPTADLDHVDVAQGNFLLNYAIQQFELGNLAGLHQIVVSVQGETESRIYRVEWDHTENDEETDTGEITVERLN